MTNETALRCPACGVELIAVDRRGVTIDACPSCRGIWLDRGELDKLVALEQATSDDFYAEVSGDSREGRGPSDRAAYGHGSKRKKKRGSFLGDFLDFG